jgi:precorrin-6B methylase 2
MKMLDIAMLTPEDFVIDLGSGDGRLVIEAARRGIRARGIEYNHDMVELSRRRAIQSGVSDRAEFIEGDLFEADLSEATVITMFLLNTINIKLRPYLLELKPGTRIVSNTFHMGDWVADSTARGDEKCDHYCTALMWIVPAKIAGTWIMNEGVMTLSQKYQMVTGSLRTPSETISINNGRLRGDLFTFTHKFQRYSGRVVDGVIEGKVNSGNKCSVWRAERIANLF